MRGSFLDQLQLIRGQCESAQQQSHASVERQGRARPNGYSLALFGRSGRPQCVFGGRSGQPRRQAVRCRAGTGFTHHRGASVDDISDVHTDMNADVHLTAYKARITPVVRGKVI